VNGIEFDGDNILRNSLFNGSYFDDIADDYICSKNLYFEFIKNNLICTTSQVMIPRIIFKDIGTSNWKYRIASDYDLYLRIAAKYNITIINKKLTYWRYLKTSVSGPNDTRRYRYISEDISILKDQCQNNIGENNNIIFFIIKEKIEEAARTYYNYGRNENKYDAIRMLRNLFAANILHPRIGIYLIALLCPPNIVSHLASVVRKIVKSRK